MRKLALFGFLLLALVLFGALHAEAKEGDAIQAEQTLPAEAAVSVIAIVDYKGNLYGLYATMRDGRVLCFDKRSGVSWQEQVKWAETAARKITVVSPFTLVGGPDTPDTAT